MPRAVGQQRRPGRRTDRPSADGAGAAVCRHACPMCGEPVPPAALRGHLAAKGLHGRLARFGAALPPAPADPAAPRRQGGLGAGDTWLAQGVLAPDAAAAAFGTLREEVPWGGMRHHGGEVPRLVCVMAETEHGAEPLYRHPTDAPPATVPFTPAVDAVRRAAEQLTGQRLNHALVQWYRGGADHIGEHADKTLDILRGSAIVNASFGATREMVLRPKPRALPRRPGARARGGRALLPRPTQRVALAHNSALVFGWDSNRLLTHEIRQDRRGDAEKAAEELRDGGGRISITLRSIATFRCAEGVYGQGAKAKARADLPLRDDGETPGMEAARMLGAFSRENNCVDFDWDASYGRGFSVSGIRLAAADAEASTAAAPPRPPAAARAPANSAEAPGPAAPPVSDGCSAGAGCPCPACSAAVAAATGGAGAGAAVDGGRAGAGCPCPACCAAAAAAAGGGTGAGEGAAAAAAEGGGA